jgi:PAS domain-containing protein
MVIQGQEAMDETHRFHTDDSGHVAPEAALSAAGRLCAAFSHASALGFAIFDDHLRYRVVNDALAAINGIPVDAHVGNTIPELFGTHIADQIAPRIKRLMATGEPIDVEVNATLPTRLEPGSYIDHYFAIKGPAGNVIEVGLVVVEVTAQRKLDTFINQLTSNLLRQEARDAWWLARELHDSVNQYHFALGTSIGHLSRTPDKSPELLAEAVESLDRRILAMRRLVTAIASSFP